MNKKGGSVLVVLGKDPFPDSILLTRRYDVIFSNKYMRRSIEKNGLVWKDVDELVEAGSIYEATAFTEELSRLTLPNGSRLVKSFKYKGFELWWARYNNLFLYFSLPYTQYQKLLDALKDFKDVYFYDPPYKSLFTCYLKAHNSDVYILKKIGFKTPTALPFGIFIQIILTILFIPILIVKRSRFMIFIGDKFEKGQDYDFRMKYIYQELRTRKHAFVEFVRSLESWKMVLKHVLVRRRPVVYSEAVVYVGKFLSFITGGHARAERMFGFGTYASEQDLNKKFKLFIASQSYINAYEDVWTIRIMKLILRLIGVRSAFVSATLERNFHAVLGCKLNNIPITGILHGVASRYYNLYDFTPSFDGEKSLSVDKYGLWSEWWKEHYIKYSKAYRPDQYYVSGPMRHIEGEKKEVLVEGKEKTGPISVLFISEQLAVPHEVLPYLEALLQDSRIKLSYRFRFYRDGFKEWLLKNRPDLINREDVILEEEGLQDAIKRSDVVVGSHSTAVLESLYQYRPPIFFDTKKWGDYFDLKEYKDGHPFFALTVEEFIARVHNAKLVSVDTLKDLQERFFGDPYRNGSAWVVTQMEEALLKGNRTK